MKFTRKTIGGFTVIELLIAIAIVGILASQAAPSLRDFLTSSRLTSQANDLVADILYARSEAATRGKYVVICPSTDQASCSAAASDWPNGRIVFVDLPTRDNVRQTTEPLLKFSGALSGSSTLAASSFNSLVAITFNPYGGLVPLGSNGSFKLCSSASTTGRQVSVSVNGRPSVTNVTCP